MKRHPNGDQQREGKLKIEGGIHESKIEEEVDYV